MKRYLCLLTTLITLCGYSQTTYQSPYTENFTTQQMERIDRTIKIDGKLITIETNIDSTNTDIQQLRIKDVIRNYDSNGENLTYTCMSLDDAYPTLVMIYLAPKIDEINVIQPKPNGDGNERYRFLID